MCVDVLRSEGEPDGDDEVRVFCFVYRWMPGRKLSTLTHDSEDCTCADVPMSVSMQNIE